MAECQAIARDASPRAILRLVELIESDDERVALMAADKVLERAWGKPKEIFDDDAEALKRLSPEQRKAEVIRLLAYAATLRPEPDGEAPTDARHWSAAGETADTPPSAQS
jgi:hypothetical protein